MDRGYFDLLQELIDLTVDYQLESLMFFHMCQKLFHELPETQTADYRSFIDDKDPQWTTTHHCLPTSI